MYACRFLFRCCPNTNKILQSTSETGITALMSTTTSPNRSPDDITTGMPATTEDIPSGIEAEIAEGSKDNENKENKETTQSCNNLQCEADNDEKPLQIDTGTETKNDAENKAKDETSTNGNKRSSDSSETNPTPTKKARPKPKPMKIDNMKEYVDSNTIDKLTTTTLFHWLKERNLHCSTRDKKADLIDKIKKQFITSTS